MLTPSKRVREHGVRGPDVDTFSGFSDGKSLPTFLDVLHERRIVFPHFSPNKHRRLAMAS